MGHYFLWQENLSLGADGIVSELFSINDTYVSTSPLATSYKAFIEWEINIWQANTGR